MVTSTPLIGRIRLTYPAGRSSVSFSGISAAITPEQAILIAGAMQHIQATPADNIFVVTETALSSN